MVSDRRCLFMRHSRPRPLGVVKILFDNGSAPCDAPGKEEHPMSPVDRLWLLVAANASVFTAVWVVLHVVLGPR